MKQRVVTTNHIVVPWVENHELPVCTEVPKQIYAQEVHRCERQVLEYSQAEEYKQLISNDPKGRSQVASGLKISPAILQHLSYQSIFQEIFHLAIVAQGATQTGDSLVCVVRYEAFPGIYAGAPDRLHLQVYHDTTSSGSLSRPETIENFMKLKLMNTKFKKLNQIYCPNQDLNPGTDRFTDWGANRNSIAVDILSNAE
ncbi:hypothetical protein ANN_21193 [Periplaneta americana]|uniref:Uncharacterized protein n=1 Tax=Periplaneta americana TaxID=6978 RepID=A0ABQ8SFT7_PERAM|nr:hypothetical protein ANN_21193 [Periplaneta americana]